MLEEPKRFSWKHWWNFVTAALLIAGIALWRARVVDGRLVFAGLVAWLLLGMVLAPALLYEHLGFADRWIFHDYVKAHRRYRKAVDTRKATPQAYCALASFALAEGDLAEAARLLEEAARYLPRDAHLHALLSRVLSKQGRHDEAISEATRAREMPNGLSAGDMALGDALAAKGDMMSAASAYQRVVEANPGSVRGRIGLARCYLALGYEDAARDEVQAALNLDPSNPDVLYWAGKVADARNERREAVRLLQTALDSRPVDDHAHQVPYRELVTTLCWARQGLPEDPDKLRSASGRHFDNT